MINAGTPPGQVKVDCSVGCVAIECDPGSDDPILVPGDPDDAPINPNDDMSEAGKKEGDEWTGVWSYLTTLPGGSSLPFAAGSVIGANTNAIAEVRQWVDPGAGMGNIKLQVFGITLGGGGRRFVHGELLNHGESTSQVTLANPMNQFQIVAP